MVDVAPSARVELGVLGRAAGVGGAVLSSGGGASAAKRGCADLTPSSDSKAVCRWVLPDHARSVPVSYTDCTYSGFTWADSHSLTMTTRTTVAIMTTRAIQPKTVAIALTMASLRRVRLRRGESLSAMIGSVMEGTRSEWSRRRDLNPRPSHYECDALPLSYSGLDECLKQII